MCCCCGGGGGGRTALACTSLGRAQKVATICGVNEHGPREQEGEERREGSRSVVLFIEEDAMTSATLALYKSPAGGSRWLGAHERKKNCFISAFLLSFQTYTASLFLSIEFKLFLPTNLTASFYRQTEAAVDQFVPACIHQLSNITPAGSSQSLYCRLRPGIMLIYL